MWKEAELPRSAARPIRQKSGPTPKLATSARVAKLAKLAKLGRFAPARVAVAVELHANRSGSAAPRIARRCFGVRGTGQEHNQPSNAAHFAALAPSLAASDSRNSFPVRQLGWILGSGDI